MRRKGALLKSLNKPWNENAERFYLVVPAERCVERFPEMPPKLLISFTNQWNEMQNDTASKGYRSFQLFL